MKNIESIFRREQGQYLIEIRLRDLEHFFNAYDPSPFYDKDLADDAEHYIVGSVRAFPLRVPLKLVFYLPQEHHPEAARILPFAIENYFDFKATMADRELCSILHEGRMALALGVLFLVICMTLRTALGFFEQWPWGGALLEGLSIAGWVAMWRPIQIFLYDWWSIYRRRRIHEKIRDMAIEVSLDPRSGQPAD